MCVVLTHVKGQKEGLEAVWVSVSTQEISHLVEEG